MKPITGTFLDEITWDIPSQNWGKKEWKKEFDTMKEAGIDTVIIIRAGLRDLAVFPSEVLKIKDYPDLAKLFLDEAERCKMKLYFGTYDTGKLEWQWANWKEDWEINKKFLPEILNRYGKHPAFHGWYISPETCVATQGSIEIYKRYSNYMKELSPDKPVLISPYYPSWVYKDASKEARHKMFIDDWSRILSKTEAVDIVAFQDGSCSFHTEGYAVMELEDYVKEVNKLCKEYKKIQWNNVETFGRNYPIKFPPIDWRLLKRKMAIAEPYCEKHITFEFSHFLSPNSMWEQAHLLYQRYMEEIVGKKK